ncbi:hypothetical protein V5P93_005226 [Actinokineospora auranticolor]|uniref:Uncharacterized protein n=1 Tax=Actinokineospora auranticolor TaxID=155976 RepID=A0A2S6GCZ5_9PSEU|nr:hypothetical protein [Actinokineospora auranticolor]PPK63082.1 hypothetical protein CLV40_13215 [Actinokineospora auranticolor]
MADHLRADGRTDPLLILLLDIPLALSFAAALTLGLRHTLRNAAPRVRAWIALLPLVGAALNYVEDAGITAYPTRIDLLATAVRFRVGGEVVVLQAFRGRAGGRRRRPCRQPRAGRLPGHVSRVTYSDLAAAPARPA